MYYLPRYIFKKNAYICSSQDVHSRTSHNNPKLKNKADAHQQ